MFKGEAYRPYRLRYNRISKLHSQDRLLYLLPLQIAKNKIGICVFFWANYAKLVFTKNRS
ncbi:MAG: hypothetical protein LBJ00_15085 [Planctomycetaceae bacterium]|nr:hypothetical protein [Planctomycetaceae bacterium]